MSVTGRIPPRSAHTKVDAGKTNRFLATLSGQDAWGMSRQARIEELRELVADGRYLVDTDRLAQAILCRVLTGSQD